MGKLGDDLRDLSSFRNIPNLRHMTWFRLTKTSQCSTNYCSICFNKSHAPLGACFLCFLFVTVWKFYPTLFVWYHWGGFMSFQHEVPGLTLWRLCWSCWHSSPLYSQTDRSKLIPFKLLFWKDWHNLRCDVINYTGVFNVKFRLVKEICICTDNSPKWPGHVFPARSLTDNEDSDVRSANLFSWWTVLLLILKVIVPMKGSIFGGLFGFPQNYVIFVFQDHMPSLISQFEFFGHS